jgi:hypothetical protein
MLVFGAESGLCLGHSRHLTLEISLRMKHSVEHLHCALVETVGNSLTLSCCEGLEPQLNFVSHLCFSSVLVLKLGAIGITSHLALPVEKLGPALSLAVNEFHLRSLLALAFTRYAGELHHMRRTHFKLVLCFISSRVLLQVIGLILSQDVVAHHVVYT